MLFFSTTGLVLRVSKSIDNLASTAVSLMPVMGILAVLTILFAFAFGKMADKTDWSNRSMNLINLERPLTAYLWGIKSFAGAIIGRTEKKKRLRIWGKSFPQMYLTTRKCQHVDCCGNHENGLSVRRYFRFSERIYKRRRLITPIEDIIKLSKADEESVNWKKKMWLYELTREIVVVFSAAGGTEKYSDRTFRENLRSLSWNPADIRWNGL